LLLQTGRDLAVSDDAIRRIHAYVANLGGTEPRRASGPARPTARPALAR
jgi:hypothetical protein